MRKRVKDIDRKRPRRKEIVQKERNRQTDRERMYKENADV
jgi:hypothetical protein